MLLIFKLKLNALTLTLLMARIAGTNHANRTVASYHFAVSANLLY